METLIKNISNGLISIPEGAQLGEIIGGYIGERFGGEGGKKMGKKIGALLVVIVAT